MATRTNTELKVFLDSATDSYDKYVDLADKSGTVFFDRNRRAVYAEGVLITSDVVDVKIEGSKLMVKKVGETTYTELADLAIPNVFVKFTENQGLTIAEQKAARANIGVKDAVNNLESTDTIAPLSANQGKILNENKVDKVSGSRLMTDAEGTKLAGIDENAQTNREVTVNGNPIGRDNEENQSTIRISGNLVDAPNNGEDSKIEFNLSHQYYPTENKIRFFKTATPPATYDETLHSQDVVLTIDTTDFVLAGMITNVEYSPEDEWLEITFPIINQTTGERENKTVEVSLSALIDTYSAGNGLSLDTKTKTFSVNNGYGLIFEGSELTVDIDTDNGLKWNNDKIAVDFTKAPVQSVNGQTGVVNIDVTPKVWSF